MNTLFVGLDVSLQDIATLCMLQDGTEAAAAGVTNDQPGIDILCRKVAALLTSHKLERVWFGLEATGIYGAHIPRALRTHPALRGFSVHVQVFNPRVIQGFKKGFSYKPKNDPTDAWFIAEKLRTGRLPRQVDVEERYEALRKLTRHRFHLVQTIAAEKQRFLGYLFFKFSGLAQQRPLRRLHGATAVALATEFPTVDALVATPLQQLVDFIVAKSHGRLEDPEAVARAVHKAARASFRLPKAMADCVNLVMATSLRSMRGLEKELKSLEQAIADIFATIPQTLTSVPGIGPVYAAGIVAEIGGIHRFPAHPALARAAGLIWSEYQTGPFTAEDTRLVKEGNTYLRYYLVEAAASVAVHDAEFRRFYQAKVKEVRKHAHKRALALTARKLVRLVHALLRKDQLYRAPRRAGA